MVTQARLSVPLSVPQPVLAKREMIIPSVVVHQPYVATHVNKYSKMLLEKIEDGQIDPSVIITHTLPLSEGPEAYKLFRDKKDACIKVVLKP